MKDPIAIYKFDEHLCVCVCVCRLNIEATLKSEVASYSNQCVTMAAELKRLEVAKTALQR